VADAWPNLVDGGVITEAMAESAGTHNPSQTSADSLI